MSREDFTRNKSKELCFDENDFLKESFSVDTFLREHRNKASLEVMRDDLGTHLKTLRLSMIELINKDYEDFVNLSKDLVGLDNEIRKIQVPLQQIKSEIMMVKNEIEDAISSFNNCLEKHTEITDKKRSLIHIGQVVSCIEKLRNIIKSSVNKEENFTLDLIERATMEFNQLQFSVSNCFKDLPENYKREASDIKLKLMNMLNNKFLECLKMKNFLDVTKCLRIYAALDQTQHLENLVRHEIIAPKLEELISESALQREPDGVGHIYCEIIKFLETELGGLFELTTHKSTPPPVKGYNFILNSFWPELENRLDLPLMFAPGNPKLFHSRFSKSVELIRKLEQLCGNQSAVLKFREHKQYQHFIQKWNLPVYYKIRFQEIAGHLEKMLAEEDLKARNQVLDNNTPFFLRSTSAVLNQLKQCWRDDVYLKELSHMFWKLSLQIMSRYSVWIDEILVKESEFQKKRTIQLGNMQTSYGMDNFQIRTRLDSLVCLFSDTNKLLSESENFLSSCKQKIPNRKLLEEELSISLQESLQLVKESLPKITKMIVTIIVSESAIHFQQVSQIPRLFRRTNRKSSAEPCEYVGHVLNLPKQFCEKTKSCLSQDILKTWLTLVFNELTVLFYESVNEVLTNAQKTEESLRKLKKKKDNYTNKNSGDEEIRQQLVIDVHSFCDGVESMNIFRDKIRMMKELIELVEMARDRSEKQ